jgi:predicted nucleic acid-binding Zn ribbon protein
VFKGSGFYATDSRAQATGASSDGEKKQKKKDSKDSKDSKEGTKPPEKKAAGSGP